MLCFIGCVVLFILNYKNYVQNCYLKAKPVVKKTPSWFSLHQICFYFVAFIYTKQNCWCKFCSSLWMWKYDYFSNNLIIQQYQLSVLLIYIPELMHFILVCRNQLRNFLYPPPLVGWWWWKCWMSVASIDTFLSMCCAQKHVFYLHNKSNGILLKFPDQRCIRFNVQLDLFRASYSIGIILYAQLGSWCSQWVSWFNLIPYLFPQETKSDCDNGEREKGRTIGDCIDSSSTF